MKNDFRFQPFVIIGTARTGSTLLWSYLNSHPDVLCLRGIYGSINKINFGKFYGELPEECYSLELLKLRNERPVEFVETYIWKKYAVSYNAIGFKYFYNHHMHLSDRHALINYLSDNTAIKILHLKRLDLLASLFSYKRALNEQNWTNANSDFQTTISIQECKDYFQKILESQKRFDHLFQGRIFDVNYKELVHSPEVTLQNILEFLGLKNIALTTTTSQNREIKLSEAISNYKELKGHFLGTEYADFFNNTPNDCDESKSFNVKWRDF